MAGLFLKDTCKRYLKMTFFINEKIMWRQDRAAEDAVLPVLAESC